MLYTDTLNLLVSKISNTIATDKQIHTYKKYEIGVSVSAILSCRPFFILIFLPYIKMNHYGFSRKSIWKTWKHFLEV
ncbi:hypothetical protein DW956_17180 [Phocaeicola vulgatus]|nr:hypothetical protein DW956_17180 [Phocaeicola vulgatus]